MDAQSGLGQSSLRVARERSFGAHRTGHGLTAPRDELRPMLWMERAAERCSGARTSGAEDVGPEEAATALACEPDVREGEDWGALLRSFVSGDTAACARVRRMIMTMMAASGAHDLSPQWEDMCQNALEAILRAMRRGGLRHPAAFAGYCSIVVRHEVGRQIGQVQRRRESGIAPVEIWESSIRSSADCQLDIDRALDALPSRHRSVIWAIYVEGHSYEEASEQLGMPFGTLKRLQTQAIKMLRSHLLSLTGSEPR
jgi:RNA polymerase sigma factor (sigma-70 family)